MARISMLWIHCTFRSLEIENQIKPITRVIEPIHTDTHIVKRCTFVFVESVWKSRYTYTRSVPVACVRLMVVVGRGARGRWWGRQVITGVGGIVTRTKRRERMRGGFPFVRVAYPCEHERKNREEKWERERERQELEASKLKRSARQSLRLPKEFAYLTTFIIRVFAWQSLLRPRLQSTRIVQHDPRADFVASDFEILGTILVGCSPF